MPEDKKNEITEVKNPIKTSVTNVVEKVGADKVKETLDTQLKSGNLTQDRYNELLGNIPKEESINYSGPRISADTINKIEPIKTSMNELYKSGQIEQKDFQEFVDTGSFSNTKQNEILQNIINKKNQTLKEQEDIKLKEQENKIKEDKIIQEASINDELYNSLKGSGFDVSYDKNGIVYKNNEDKIKVNTYIKYKGADINTIKNAIKNGEITDDVKSMLEKANPELMKEANKQSAIDLYNSILEGTSYSKLEENFNKNNELIEKLLSNTSEIDTEFNNKSQEYSNNINSLKNNIDNLTRQKNKTLEELKRKYPGVPDSVLIADASRINEEIDEQIYNATQQYNSQLAGYNTLIKSKELQQEDLKINLSQLESYNKIISDRRNSALEYAKNKFNIINADMIRDEDIEREQTNLENKIQLEEKRLKESQIREDKISEEKHKRELERLKIEHENAKELLNIKEEITINEEKRKEEATKISEGIGINNYGITGDAISYISTEKGFDDKDRESMLKEYKRITLKYGENSDEVKDYIKTKALETLGATESNNFEARETALNQLKDIRSDINKLASTGKLGLIEFGLSNFEEKLTRDVKDPAIVSLAIKINKALQSYTKAVSGAAFSNKEYERYKAIFPDLTKGIKVNTAIIDAQLPELEKQIDRTYEKAMGASNYRRIFKGIDEKTFTTYNGKNSNIEQILQKDIDRIGGDDNLNASDIIDSANEFGINPNLVAAFIRNDSSYGKKLYSKYNYGNVGNTDTLVAEGKKGIEFNTPKEGIDAVSNNLKKRIDAYKSKYGQDKIPSVKELATGRNDKDGTKFFGVYMTDSNGPSRVENIYNSLEGQIIPIEEPIIEEYTIDETFKEPQDIKKTDGEGGVKKIILDGIKGVWNTAWGGASKIVNGMDYLGSKTIVPILNKTVGKLLGKEVSPEKYREFTGSSRNNAEFIFDTTTGALDVGAVSNLTSAAAIGILSSISGTDIGGRTLEILGDTLEKGGNITSKLPGLKQFRDALPEDRREEFDTYIGGLVTAGIIRGTYKGGKAILNKNISVDELKNTIFNTGKKVFSEKGIKDNEIITNINKAKKGLEEIIEKGGIDDLKTIEDFKLKFNSTKKGLLEEKKELLKKADDFYTSNNKIGEVPPLVTENAISAIKTIGTEMSKSLVPEIAREGQMFLNNLDNINKITPSEFSNIQTKLRSFINNYDAESATKYKELLGVLDKEIEAAVPGIKEIDGRISNLIAGEEILESQISLKGTQQAKETVKKLKSNKVFDVIENVTARTTSKFIPNLSTAIKTMIKKGEISIADIEREVIPMLKKKIKQGKIEKTMKQDLFKELFNIGVSSSVINTLKE